MQVRYEFNQRDLGHGAAATMMHPAVAVALVITVVFLLWRPRKYMLAALILCTFLVPHDEVLVIAGAHFYVRLIVALAGFVRVVTGKFQIAGGLNNIDKLFIAWASYRVIAATITNWPTGGPEQAAFYLQAICGYFLLRYLIRDQEDIITAAKSFAVATLILGVLMVFENRLRVNLFGAYIGGVTAVPEIRNGTARAQAVFSHSILAGCFGATLLPLFVWLWSKKKMFGVLGIVGSTLMVMTTESSTPVMSYAGAILALCLWPIRGSMRLVRWVIVAGFLATALMMNAPVWYVIAHIDPVGGSGGWDRAMLLDVCIKHFGDWWLIGTNQNGSWGYDMWDQSDQFVAEAEVGGLFCLVCFISIVSRAFGWLGNMRKKAEQKDDKEKWLCWCLGCVLFAHVLSYFGVSYFDQSQMWWYAFLAMVSAVTIPLRLPDATSEPAKSMKTDFTQFRKPAQAGAGSAPSRWSSLHSMHDKNSAK